MSNTILRKYLPGADFADNRDLNDGVHDKVFKNVALQKQHGLMYVELSHAMNHGNVGCILQLWPYWIAIFKSMGKSKYTAHMIRFIMDLDHVYPPQLR